MGQRQLYKKGETIHKTINSTEYTKYKAHTKQETNIKRRLTKT
jgi:hypothetical protein